MLDNHYDYLTKLLLLQSYAVEDLKHNLSKGEMREEFLRELIIGEFKNTNCHSGFIVDENFHSSQIDIIITNIKSSNMSIGGQSLVYLNDARMTIEVKTSGETKHLDDLEKNAIEIKRKLYKKNQFLEWKNKSKIQEPKIGMFAYGFNLNKRNFLRKFGYNYNGEIDSYEKDKTINVKYKNIDFISVFNFNDSEEKDILTCDSVFITRNIIDNQYVYENGNPVKLLFSLIKNINEQ